MKRQPLITAPTINPQRSYSQELRKALFLNRREEDSKEQLLLEKVDCKLVIFIVTYKNSIKVIMGL